MSFWIVELRRRASFRRQLIRRRKFASLPLIFHSEMLQRLGGAAFPFSHRFISEVLQILNAHLARPEAASGQIAKTGEESRAVGKLRVDLPRVRYVIQHLPSLNICTLDEKLVEPRVAQMIDER